MDKEEKAKSQAEKKRITKYAQKRQAEIEAEPKLRCTFVNMETKGLDLAFTYEGLRFHLEDGKEYELPISVVEHLNSLKVPVKRYKTDPASGQLKPETEVSQMLQRFSVIPKSLADYTQKLKVVQEEH
jgi:hypothetical protein